MPIFDMEISLIQVVKAQTDTTSHPTIPFGGPIGSVTPTPTSTPVNTGPTIYLVADKGTYKLNETGNISIKINTINEEIDEFRITIEFDATHLDIIDDDPITGGVQINYIDTHFIPDENSVTINNSTGKGTITIHAKAQNNISTTVSNRTVAIIDFKIRTSKNTEVKILPDQSSLFLNNTEKLDKNSLKSIFISSNGIVNPSNTGTPRPIPNTAITSPESVFFVLIGALLILTGIHLRNKIKEQGKK